MINVIDSSIVLLLLLLLFFFLSFFLMMMMTYFFPNFGLFNDKEWEEKRSKDLVFPTFHAFYFPQLDQIVLLNSRP